MTAHPDYPQDRGTPQGDRCTCGGIRYWHAAAPYGCDDCDCAMFTPEAADDGWDAAQAWIDDEDDCVADPENVEEPTWPPVTIKEWIRGGCVSTDALCAELRQWADIMSTPENVECPT